MPVGREVVERSWILHSASQEIPSAAVREDLLSSQLPQP